VATLFRVQVSDFTLKIKKAFLVVFLKVFKALESLSKVSKAFFQGLAKSFRAKGCV
jgi:hypothetical protein